MHNVSLLYKYELLSVVKSSHIRPFHGACELFTVVVSLVSECKALTFQWAMNTVRNELLLCKYIQYENNGHLWHVFNLVQRQAGIPML